MMQQELDPKVGIVIYQLLSDSNRDIVDNYILDNDIYSEECFQHILHSRLLPYRRIIYLIKYCNDQDKYFGDLVDILHECNDYDWDISVGERKLITRFLRSTINNSILDESMVKDIKELNIIGNDERESLQYMIDPKSLP
jgi:hypothetical protein